MVYYESVNLIGSFTVFYLLMDNSCEEPMKIVLLSILTNHEAFHQSPDACFTPQCTSCAVFETFEHS